MKSVGSGGANGGAGASMSSLVNRLHNGQTAATRAKAAEIQVPVPYFSVQGCGYTFTLKIYEIILDLCSSMLVRIRIQGFDDV
jgi:hypothetical protein